MTHHVSMIYPLTSHEMLSRKGICEAAKLRMEIAFQLTKMDADLCQEEIEALLFDSVNLIDAISETEDSKEDIEIGSLSRSDHLVLHAETLRLALEAERRTSAGSHSSISKHSLKG